MPSVYEYQRFKEWLKESGKDHVQLSFSQVEEIIGSKLSPAARKYDAWWSNHPSHPLTIQWLEAGYKADSHSLTAETVTLSRTRVLQSDTTPIKFTKGKDLKPIAVPDDNKEQNKSYSIHLNFGSYSFDYLQDIHPERNDDGSIKEYLPQKDYANKDNLSLSKYGGGSFCRFSLQTAGMWRGVYLWVSDGEIIYVGETENLKQRFNIGYGNISPRNCYIGGQSTNCKMNKVILNYYKSGRTVQVYFLHTDKNKEVELELLNAINTKYNVKDNGGD